MADFKFTSFNEKVFWEAINRKPEPDYLRLKVNTISVIRNDPTFARGEFSELYKILKERVPEIFEDEITLDFEERLERDKWDKSYFTKLTYWLQENFAIERIKYIKEVGKEVHKDTAKTYAESMKIGRKPAGKPTVKPPAISGNDAKKAPSTMPQQKKENPIKASEKLPKVLLVIALIVMVAALVLSIMLPKNSKIQQPSNQQQQQAGQQQQQASQ